MPCTAHGMGHGLATRMEEEEEEGVEMVEVWKTAAPPRGWVGAFRDF